MIDATGSGLTLFSLVRMENELAAELKRGSGLAVDASFQRMVCGVVLVANVFAFALLSTLSCPDWLIATP